MRIALVLLLAACGDPERIPCSGDDTCPTGWFCDNIGICQRMSATSSPPDVVFDGVSNDQSGPFGGSLDFDTRTRGAFFMSMTNQGSEQADNVSVTFAGPSCLGLIGPGSNLIGIIDGGMTDVEQVDCLPSPTCASPATVMVTVSQKYRGSDGSQLSRDNSGSFVIRLIR
jgi:hypothetical protein